MVLMGLMDCRRERCFMKRFSTGLELAGLSLSATISFSTSGNHKVYNRQFAAAVNARLAGSCKNQSIASGNWYPRLRISLKTRILEDQDLAQFYFAGEWAYGTDT